MMSYSGLIAIYTQKDKLKPLIGSAKNWIWYSGKNTFNYASLSDCLIFRLSAYKENSNRLDFPFILIKPTEKLFGFIDWDMTSIYYSFSEIGKDKLIIKEIHSEALKNLNNPKRSDEIIDLNTILWFDINKFDKAFDLYHGNISS